MIKYPLKLKITCKSFADLNYRIFKEGNEISYKLVEDELLQAAKYVITNSVTEDKALYEILYEILLELNLSPVDLAKIVTPLHCEVVLNGQNDFIFYQSKEDMYSWSYTKRD